MSQVTMHGNPLQTNGELPTVGQDAPSFELTAADMSPVKLSDSNGKVRIFVDCAFGRYRRLLSANRALRSGIAKVGGRCRGIFD